MSHENYISFMRIVVEAKTHAKEQKIIQKDENTFIVYVTTPPVEGKANKQIIKLLSKYLKVAPSCITFISGETSKQKVFEIVL